MSPQHAVVTLLASFSLGLPSYAAAGVAVAAADNAGAKSTWVQRIRDARDELESAQARYAAAVQAYGGMRHRRRERGEAKAEIIEEQEAAREAVTQAGRDLDAVLEEARRAGVRPGWIREALERAPANGQAH